MLAALARGALGESYGPEVPDRMLDTIAHLPSQADRAQLITVLRALDTRAGALLLGGPPVPASWLSPSEAEALLRRWKSGTLPLHRHLSAGVLSLAMAAAYGHPGREWDRIGYPGPLGRPPAEPKRLHPIEIDADDVMKCDVVVVGSGAGGGCVAAHLATAGLDVVVLEKGRYLSESDFTHLEAEATRDMYLYGATLTTSDLGCRILAGSTLGGGTVVNYTTSFRTPAGVLEQWARVSGIDAFTSGEFDQSLDEVSARLGVNSDSSAAGRRDALIEEGLKKLGFHVDMMPRAVRGCSQDEHCGYCGFGCRIGAKQSTMRTYLEDAASHGARLVIGADVRKVAVSDWGATGVEATANGHRLTVTAGTVVVAAGAIETPALLLRSGVRNHVGRDLHLHPGTAAIGIFDDEVRGWEGTLQARYSNELRDMDDGYGPILETIPVHPISGATALPWVGAVQHRELMSKFPYVGHCAVLPRDAGSGRVRLTREGGPRVDYKLSREDERRIAEGVVAAGKVLERAGAKEIFSLHHEMISYRPGPPGAHERWADQTRRAGYRDRNVTLASFHQMGSCRMGSDAGSSAVGPDNESHEVRNLYVVDGSNFPTASGVNPMLSIYGIANRAAKKMVRRLS